MMRSIAKSTIGTVARRFAPLLDELEHSLSIFAYHDVSDTPAPFSREYELAIGTRQFEDQIRFITQTFNVISMDELLGGRVSRRAALITFDDGFSGTFQHALPILHKLGVPSTVFLNMAAILGEPFWSARAIYLCRHVEGFIDFLIERAGQWVLEQPYMACSRALVEEWEAVHGNKYLADLPDYTGPFARPDNLKAADVDPLVTFGSHGYNHFNLLGMPDRDIEESERVNAAAMSKYRSWRPVFAFPYGGPRSFMGRHIHLLLRLGHKRIFTGLPLFNKDVSQPVLHRLVLNSWHDRRSRLWYQIARTAVDGKLRRCEDLQVAVN